MIIKTIPKFLLLDVFRIEGTTNQQELCDFLMNNGYKVATIRKANNGFILNEEKEGIVYKEGTLLFFIEGKLHYISSSDESIFWEFFQENTDGVKVKVTSKKKQTHQFQQFQCPECNFIATSPFTKCPNCGAVGDNVGTLEFTDITAKIKNRGKKMDNTQNNNVEEVQEVEETKVTAVYGDYVSVNNSEVQSNIKPAETTNEEASCI